MSASEAFDLLFTPISKPLSETEAKLFSEARQSTVASRRQTVAVYSWGNGPAVLLVHGWGDRGTIVGSFVPSLVKSGFRPVFFDGPGHGRTDGPYCDQPLIADAILSVSESEGPIYGVIAHSIGAIATILALDIGFMAKRAALISCSPWFKQVVEEFTAALEISGDREYEFMQYIEKRLGADVWDITRGETIMPTLDVPVLIYHDRKDRDASYEHGTAIAETWPNALFKITDGLGHNRMLTDADLIQTVLDYICITD